MAFGKPPVQQTQQAAGGARKSRFEGVKAAGARYPIPGPGNYLFEVLDTKVTDGKGPEWFNAELLVIESDNPQHAPGTKCTMLQCLTGKAFKVGGPKVKQFVIAACGYDSEDAFDAANEDWPSMVDAICGEPEAQRTHGVNPLAGAKANCAVTAGNKVGDNGIVFVDYYWTAA